MGRTTNKEKHLIAEIDALSDEEMMLIETMLRTQKRLTKRQQSAADFVQEQSRRHYQNNYYNGAKSKEKAA